MTHACCLALIHLLPVCARRQRLLRGLLICIKAGVTRHALERAHAAQRFAAVLQWDVVLLDEVNDCARRTLPARLQHDVCFFRKQGVATALAQLHSRSAYCTADIAAQMSAQVGARCTVQT
jgi:hypothetical protein